VTETLRHVHADRRTRVLHAARHRAAPPRRRISFTRLPAAHTPPSLNATSTPVISVTITPRCRKPNHQDTVQMSSIIITQKVVRYGRQQRRPTASPPGALQAKERAYIRSRRRSVGEQAQAQPECARAAPGAARSPLGIARQAAKRRNAVVRRRVRSASAAARAARALQRRSAPPPARQRIDRNMKKPVFLLEYTRQGEMNARYAALFLIRFVVHGNAGVKRYPHARFTRQRPLNAAHPGNQPAAGRQADARPVVHTRAGRFRGENTYAGESAEIDSLVVRTAPRPPQRFIQVEEPSRRRRVIQRTVPSLFLPAGQQVKVAVVVTVQAEDNT